MDIEASSELAKLIKQITETGDWTLDDSTLKSIKSMCKRSDANVHAAFDNWFAQLKKEHAQIRYSCVQLAEQLFQRSHQFRSLLADEFPQFIALTIGIRQLKLPPPTSVATKLKQYSLSLVQAWNAKFGTKYRQIAIGCEYLEHNGILKASQPSIDTIHLQDEERANRQVRMQPVYERRFEQITEESDEYLSIIKENLQQMEGCFEILIPKLDEESSIDFDSLIKGDLNLSENANENPDTYKEKIRSHGIASSRYKLTITMSDNPVADEVHESKENQVVYEQLREGYKLARTKHNKQLNEWINSVARIEISNKDEQKTLLKKLLSVKAEMAETLRKAELLGIQLPPDEPSDDDEEFEDELFEEVKVPSRSSVLTKSRKGKQMPLAQKIFPLAFEPGMEEDVTYNRERVFPKESKSPEPVDVDRSNNKGKKRVTAEDTQKEELLKRAPVVEWGDDLYYWDKTDVQFNTSGIERSHRFMGVGEGTNEMPEQLLDQLRKRTIYYKPQMPTNIKACRAPLRSGQLCPRRDLVTCPFHGKIIPRDELGIPVKENDRAVAGSSTATEINETMPAKDIADDDDDFWQDIERDVMQQVDQPLIELNKQKRKRKKPQSNLADIRKKKETSYTRLQSKVDAPNTRRAVEEAQDYERSLKARDKKMNLW